MATLTIQKWSAEVHKQLFETVDFTSYSKSYETMVDSSKFTLPSQGAITASVDDYTRPLTPTTRTDTGVEIEMIGLRTDPFYVQLDEQWELSYDKRADITSQLSSAISDLARQKVYWSWMNTSKFANSVKTTGDATASVPTGGTGTRKKVTYADIMNATEKLDLQNVPSEGRVMVIHPSMYKDIKGLTQFTASDSISTELLSMGVVGYVDGIKVIKANVSNVLVDAVASGSTASGATFGATGTTYSYFAAVYHPDYVGKVIGPTQLFLNQKDATYTSDVITVTQRYGGGLTREDQKGYIAIVQEIGS